MPVLLLFCRKKEVDGAEHMGAARRGTAAVVRGACVWVWRLYFGGSGPGGPRNGAACLYLDSREALTTTR